MFGDRALTPALALVARKVYLVWERRLYRWLTDEGGGEHACEAIPEQTCSEVPHSFVLNTATHDLPAMATLVRAVGKPAGRRCHRHGT
jgi:hypothetical protein